jgi:predicted nuclease with TOPRIM domain
MLYINMRPHAPSHHKLFIFVKHLTAKQKATLMRSIASIAESLKAKTEKSIHLHDTLRKDNAQLKLAVSELRRRVEELETQNKQLEEKNRILRIARSVSGENDNNLSLKLKINELVREIDKCIAQLSR